MSFNRRQFNLGATAMAAGLALPAHASGYPDRDITFISPWSAGGGLDVNLRVFIKLLEKELKGNINLENRVGASGTIGVGMVQRAKPDGYTVGYAGGAIVAYQPLVMKGLSFKSMDDLQPIIMLNSMPTLLAVRADSPIKNFQDFLAEVKAKPNQVRVGMAGVGAALELGQINQISNVKIRTVQFSGGTSETVIALLGGRIEAIASYTEGLKPHAEAGTMRVIAAFTKQKYDPFPNATAVGTMPEYANTQLLPTTSYFIGPKGMPDDVLKKLQTASRAVVTGDEFKAFAKNAGLVLDPKGPEEIKAECKRLATVYESVYKTLDKG